MPCALGGFRFGKRHPRLCRGIRKWVSLFPFAFIGLLFLDLAVRFAAFSMLLHLFESKAVVIGILVFVVLFFTCGFSQCEAVCHQRLCSVSASLRYIKLRPG